MSLLGKAAVAMWWNVRPEQRAEFGDWHSHEHFPERMGIPGFRRGSRWTSTLDTEGFFVLYELEQYDTLTSRGYLDAAQRADPVVDENDAASSEHGAQPVPGGSELRRWCRDVAGDDQAIAPIGTRRTDEGDAGRGAQGIRRRSPV